MDLQFCFTPTDLVLMEEAVAWSSDGEQLLGREDVSRQTHRQPGVGGTILAP